MTEGHLDQLADRFVLAFRHKNTLRRKKRENKVELFLKPVLFNKKKNTSSKRHIIFLQVRKTKSSH